MANTRRYFVNNSKDVSFMKHWLDTDIVDVKYTDGTIQKIDLDELSNRLVVFINQGKGFNVSRSIEERYVLYNGFTTVSTVYTPPAIGTPASELFSPIASTQLPMSDMNALEPTLIRMQDGKIRMYHTYSVADNNHVIVCATANGIEEQFAPSTTTLIGKGVGGADALQSASSSHVVYEGGFYYCFALDGYGFDGSETRNVFLYKSADGLTGWTKVGTAFPTNGGTRIGYGNTTLCVTPTGEVVKVGGKYKAIVEATDGVVWSSWLAEADNIEGPWTILQQLPRLAVIPGSMAGGGQLIYAGDMYHIFYHYGTNGNLPTNIGYAYSADLITWAVQAAPMIAYYAMDDTPPEPMAYANAPFANTSQVADPYVLEVDGATYLVAEFVDNNLSPTVNRIYMWKYTGTFLQMVENLNPTPYRLTWENKDADIQQIGNGMYYAGASGAWGNVANSVEEFSEGQYIEWDITSMPTSAVIGLNKVFPIASHTDIDYAFVIQNDRSYYLHQNNAVLQASQPMGIFYRWRMEWVTGSNKISLKKYSYGDSVATNVIDFSVAPNGTYRLALDFWEQESEVRRIMKGVV